MDPIDQAPSPGIRPSLMARVLLGLIAVYRYFLSPFLGRQCRFHPTCSSFGHDAVLAHGALRGAGLTLWRIARCHPWAEGGYDPVPPTDASNPRTTDAAD